jgi:hypothetical protein
MNQITMTLSLLRLTAGITLLALSAAGCSNVDRFDVPKNPTTGNPSVRSIVKRIKCELAEMAADNYHYKAFMDAGDFVVAMQLSLTVNDDGSLAPAFTYTNGLFSFNAGAKLDASREQNFTEQLIYSIEDIRTEMKLAQLASKKKHREVDSFTCPIIDTNLAGELGLVKSAEMAFTSEGLNLGTKLSGSSGAFGGYVDFVVTKNLNSVGPTWTLQHFKGPGSLAGVSEINTDKLTFAFAERSATGTIPRAVQSAQAQALLFSILTSQISTQIGNLKGVAP